MNTQERITARLKQEFEPIHLEVINESSGHNVPRGSETHFKVIIVSDSFDGLGRVQRQQKVYYVLSDELKNGVHALSQHTYTPEEWKTMEPGGLAPSPQCMGGHS